MLQTPGPFIPVDVHYNHERVLAEYPRTSRGHMRRGRPVRDRAARLRRLVLNRL